MVVGDSVTWEDDVLPCWQRAAGGAKRPNSDVWRELPPGVTWNQAEVEKGDLDRMFLIGSGDWREVFGTFQLAAIPPEMAGHDKYRHQERVRAIAGAIQRGEELERLILVSDTEHSSFVLIDGNHRALAYHTLCSLVGVGVYLGTVPEMLARFPWARSVQ